MDKELEKEVELEEENEAAEETAEAENAEEAAEAEAEEQPSREQQLEKELAEQQDKYLRLMAEYDNYRRRTAKQTLETRDKAVGDTVMEIIPIYDNLERAMQTETSDDKYKAGVEMIYKQFTAMLDKMKIKIIDPTGEPFDPAVANAVSQIENPELGENVVAQVFEKGVMIGDKMLRYAMVVVANP